MFTRLIKGLLINAVAWWSSPIISLIIGLKKPLLSWDCPSLGRNEIKPVEDKTTPRSIIGGRVEDKHSRWNG